MFNIPFCYLQGYKLQFRQSAFHYLQMFRYWLDGCITCASLLNDILKIVWFKFKYRIGVNIPPIWMWKDGIPMSLIWPMFDAIEHIVIYILKVQMVHFAISLWIKNFILLNFQWQTYSKFNNPCIISLNVTKIPLYTPTHQELSNSTKNIVRSVVVWEILTWQNNQIIHLDRWIIIYGCKHNRRSH